MRPILKIISFITLAFVLAQGVTGAYPGFRIADYIDIPTPEAVFEIVDISVSGQAYDVSEVAAQASSSVVSVNMYKEVPAYELRYREYSGRRGITQLSSQKVKVAAGTGFFVSSNGYLLTNNHVVFDETAEYRVEFGNGNEMVGQVVYRDPGHDLAIVKIEGGEYAPLPLGDSSKVRIGTQVIDIGNAYGLSENLVSTGNVSALNRNIVASGPHSYSQRLRGLIETDAALYPGDSGGPLLDTSGQVIGINVAAAEDANPSFSIPVNVAKNMIAESGLDI